MHDDQGIAAWPEPLQRLLARRSGKGVATVPRVRVPKTTEGVTHLDEQSQTDTAHGTATSHQADTAIQMLTESLGQFDALRLRPPFQRRGSEGIAALPPPNSSCRAPLE